jgi:hypothetical protein
VNNSIPFKMNGEFMGRKEGKKENFPVPRILYD